MWFANDLFPADHDSNRRKNIWRTDTARRVRQVTHFTDYTSTSSLGGPGRSAGIVFQQGGKLHVLDVHPNSCMTLT